MKNLLAAFALALASITVSAGPPSAESVDQLLVASRTETLMDSMYASMDQMMRVSMKQAVGDKPMSPEQQQLFDRLPAKFVALMRDELGWAKIRPYFVSLFQESYDQAEVDGLIAFYGSPAGRAYLDKTPVVMQKSMAFVQEQMQKMMPRMRSLIDETLNEAKVGK